MFGDKNSGGGMAILMKSMGIDPQAINQQLEAAKTTAVNIVRQFDARLQAIEARLAKIEASQERIESMLQSLTADKILPQ